MLVMAVFLYFNWEQEVDFATLLPDELERCGTQIDQNSKEYIHLETWLKSNQSGWKDTPVTYVPSQTYISPNLSINILVGGVVINYKSESGGWKQVIQSTDTSGLFNECSNVDKSF